MNVYGELTSAQAENLGADPALSSVRAGRLWWRTDISQFKADLGGSADTLAMLAATQTFSNKSVSDSWTMAQVATPSAPSAGFTKLYAKNDGNLYILPNGGSETKVLTAAGTYTAPTVQKFLSTGTTSGYLFTCSSANATVGATYTNNGNTYTVLGTIASGTQLFCSGTSAPTASGTLTKSGGTGDATITFSANAALATYTKPAGVLYLRVRMVGGGGGGGGGGTSGWGTPGSGTVTAFGVNLLVANGGPGGAVGGAAGVAGGTASLGTAIGIALTGASGGYGGLQTPNGGGSASGVPGAVSPFGGAGGGGGQSGIPGLNAAANTGSGGGGAGPGPTISSYGGGGGSAGGFIDAIISSPAATYVYCVGAGGAGGAAGASGTTAAGGNGGSGIIEVTEYYQ